MATTNGTVQQLTSENFINPFGILKPQIRRQLIGYQTENYFTDDMEEQEMEEPAYGPTWSTFIEPKKIELITVATAFSAGTTDGLVTITITPSGISSLKSFARARMRLRRGVNGNLMFVESVDNSAMTITVRPPTGTAIAAGAVGEIFTLIGNASPEASNGLDGYTGKPRKIDNQLQIMKGAARSSGSLTGDELWVDLEKYGAQGQGWFDYEILAEVARFKYQMNVSLILEEMDTLSIAAQYGTYATNTVAITNGIVPQIRRDGKVIPYSAGEPSLQWFYKIMNTLTGQYGDKENWFYAGQELRQNNTQWIIDQFKNGAINYASFSGSKEVAISMGFSSIEIDNFSFHQKNFDLYNMPDGLGAQGFTRNGFIIPTTPVKVVANAEGGSKGMGKPVRIRYKPMKGGQRMRIVPLDGLRTWDVPTSSDDVFTYQMIAEWGSEMLAPWKGVVIDYAA